MKIIAKIPAEKGCHVVILARDKEGKQIWGEVDGVKQPMVRAVPLGFLGFDAQNYQPNAMLGVVGFAAPSPWTPLDKKGLEIVSPIDYLGPGETLQDWAAKKVLK